MWKGMLSKFEKIMVGLTGIVFAIVLLNNLIFQYLDYGFKVKFLLPNIVLFLIGGVVFLAWIKFCKRKRKWDIEEKKTTKIIAILSGILFLFQCFVVYNIYFMPGWDPGMVARNAAFIADGDTASIEWDYFSTYPNNCGILAIYTVFFKLGNTIGLRSIFIRPIIAMGQCLISSLTGFLVYLVSKKLFERSDLAVYAWILYVLLIGLNPWWIIPYTDATCIFIPVFLIWLYERGMEKDKSIFTMVLIGIVGLIGYQLKATNAIPLLAILFHEILVLIKRKGRNLVRVCVLISTAGMLFLSFQLCDVYEKIGYEIDKDASVGIWHYAMMGLNDVSDGAFYAEDVYYSQSFDTAAERTKANKKVAIERVKNYGVVGLGKHTIKKMLGTYNDGTFGWWNEGEFRSVETECPNQIFAPTLREIYYKEGKAFPVFRLVMQTIWLLVLDGMACNVLALRDKMSFGNKECMVIIAITLIGFFLFELLFEGRARYCYIFTPVFLIFAMNGYGCFFRRFLKKGKR